jgi:uncharacterized protein YjaZ
MLKVCDWDGFLEAYLKPNRRIIDAYYRNFVTDGTRPWNECVEMYRRRWFEEAEHREQVLDRLRGFDFRRHAEHCMTQIEPVLPGAMNVDVVILLGVGTSNAFQLLMDGKPVVCVAVEAWGGKFYNVDLPFDDVLIWLAHEMGHALRYRHPTHPLAEWFHKNGFRLGEAASRLPLYEFLVDEGLAVTASRFVAPERPLHQILGYTQEQLVWCVEHEKEVLFHLETIWRDPPGAEGYWRYFGDGGEGLPERVGYYVGYRLVSRMLERYPDLTSSELFEVPAAEFVRPV